MPLDQKKGSHGSELQADAGDSFVQGSEREAVDSASLKWNAAENDTNQKRVSSLRNSLRLWLSCLMEHTLLLPIWILFVVYAWPEGQSFIWLGGLPLLSLIGALLSLRMRRLWQRGVMAVCLGAGYASLPLIWLPRLGFPGSDITAGPARVLLMVQAAAFLGAAVVCTMQGLTAAAREGQYRLYWAAIANYFIAGIVFPKVPLLSDTVPLLTWAGAACVAAVLFVTNHQHLRYNLDSTGSHERLPAGLKRHNRLFMAAIIAASLLLAAGVGRWIGGVLWELLRGLIQWLTRSPAPEPILPEEPPAMPARPPLPEEVSEPGMLAELLNILFYVFGGLVIALLIGGAIYWLYRHGGTLWRKSIARLLSLLRRESPLPSQEVYRDEEKNIFSWEDTLQGWRQAASRLFGVRAAAPERWEEMKDSRKQVRYLYRQFLRKERDRGYSLKAELTPRETAEDIRCEQARQPELRKASGRRWKGNASSQSGPWGLEQAPGDSVIQRLLKLYYPARYGDKPINEEEVAELHRNLLP
ncbi:DUF4129 domain-containing protein [Paenibacillus sanguinis]|uniref:DUF4129 domain-containing protein n=1 Tax=Paenibacillus sanguinis TaxID=225906 RepID=UPI00035D9BA2|nr:DUF4129 domain-containing protein [Paenibacillus sanguinis]